MTESAPASEVALAKKSGSDAGGKELPAEHGTVAAMIADWGDRETLDHSVVTLKSSAGFWVGLSALQSLILALGFGVGGLWLTLLALVPLTLEALRRTVRGFVDHSVPTLGEVIQGAPQHIFRATFLAGLLVLGPAFAMLGTYVLLLTLAMLTAPIFMASGSLGAFVGIALGSVIFAVAATKIWSKLAVLVLSVPALALGERPFLAFRRTLTWLPARRPWHYFEVLPLVLPIAFCATLYGLIGSVLPSLVIGIFSTNVFLLHATHRYLRDYCRWAVHVRRKSVGLTTFDPDMLLPE